MNTLYLEDLKVGDTWRSAGRTATEADLTTFCMLSGDWNPIHCNSEYAAKTQFGERLVPGLFGLSLITGAMSQWGIFEESAIAMLNLSEWTFHAPILCGDTLYIEMRIETTRPTSKPGIGIIGRRFRVLGSEDRLIQEGFSDMMIRARPS